MDMESFIFQMDLSSKEHLKMDIHKDMVEWFILMVVIFKERYLKTKLKGKGIINLKHLNTKVCLVVINFMVKDNKNVQMVQVSKDYIKMVENNKVF